MLDIVKKASEMIRPALIALLLSTAPAVAMDGELAATKFPFAIGIDMKWKDGGTGPCSGVVVEPNLVMTAAHCTWGGSRYGYVTGVRVDYTDANGRAQSVWSKRVIVPPLYIEANALHIKHRNGMSSRDFMLKALRDELTKEFRDRDYELKMQMNVSDFAYIVPERPIHLSKYPKWLFSEVAGNSDSSKMKSALDQIVGKPSKGVLVGSGRFGCKNREEASTCMYDKKSRWAEVPVLANIWPYANDNDRVPIGRNGTSVLVKDWAWWFGKDPKTGKNPTNHIDSGGPALINMSGETLQPANGPWMLVGIASDGEITGRFSTYVSPYLFPEVYYSVTNSAEYKSLKKRLSATID
jgi:trypsin